MALDLKALLRKKLEEDEEDPRLSQYESEIKSARDLEDVASINASLAKMGSLGGEYYKSDLPEFAENRTARLMDDMRGYKAKKIDSQKSVLEKLSQLQNDEKTKLAADESKSRQDLNMAKMDYYKNRSNQPTKFDPLGDLRRQRLEQQIANDERKSDDPYSNIPEIGQKVIKESVDKYGKLDNANTLLEEQTNELERIYKTQGLLRAKNFAELTLKSLLNAATGTAEAVGVEEAKRLSPELNSAFNAFLGSAKPVDLQGFINKTRSYIKSIDNASQAMKSDTQRILKDKDWLGQGRRKGAGPEKMVSQPDVKPVGLDEQSRKAAFDFLSRHPVDGASILLPNGQKGIVRDGELEIE